MFEPGRPKTGGRMKGSRNRLSHAFVDALYKEFEEFGSEAIRIARIERPHEFLKVIASIMPKEFEIIDTRLKEISDAELDLLIGIAKRQLAASNDLRNAESGEGETIN